MAGMGLLRRMVEPRLGEALEDSPVVLIHGPRQCGKTTLARMSGEPAGFEYFSFDDAATREAASADPAGFVADLPERAILDEIQHVPALFAALKVAVDRRRSAGRFLLAGSTNILLLPKLGDSLAGRMAIVRLHPLAQCEIGGESPRFLDALFGARFKTRPSKRLGADLVERIVAGGYPAALARRSAKRRTGWYVDYVETIVQRDVRDLARVAALDLIPRLIEGAAAQTARLANVSDLAAPFQVSRPTIRDYVILLERVFLLDSLPPWHTNRLSRLIKTPKLHLGDTGVAAAVLGFDVASLLEDRVSLGRLLETFVFQELRRLASAHDRPIRFHHFRDRDGVEVDLVLERSALELAGVEVKAAATVTAADFNGLRKLRDVTGRRFACGAILYDGETQASFGDRLFAVPLRALWEG